MNYANPFGSYPPSAVVDNLLGESYHVVKTVYNSLALLLKIAESESLEFVQTNWETLEPLIQAGDALKNINENLDEVLKSSDYAAEAESYAELAKKWAVQLETPVEDEDYSSKYWALQAQTVSDSLNAVVQEAQDVKEYLESISDSLSIVSENIEYVQSVSSSIDAVKVVAADLSFSEIPVTTDLGMVGDDPDNTGDAVVITGGTIATVAQNIEHVETVAKNLDVIEDALQLIDDYDEMEETLQNYVLEANTSVNKAQNSQTAAAQSESNASDYAQYAKDWAIKTDGLVLDTDYSSKYYALQAADSAESAAASAASAIASDRTTAAAAEEAAEASETAVQSAEDAKFYMQMSKMWAIKTDGSVEDNENSAKYYAYRARRDRLLAQDWAIKLDDMVDGIDYSAKYWAQLAQQAADSAQANADYVAQNVQVIVDNIESINTVAENINAVAAVGDNIQLVINVGADLVGDNTLDNILDYGILGNENPEVPVIVGGTMHTIVDNLELLEKIADYISNGDIDTIITAATVVSTALDKLQQIQVVTEGYKDQAADYAANAATSADLAKDWAIKMDDTVDGEEYSAKYYANQAKETVEAATADIEAAGQAQIEAIQAEGASQVEAVNTAGSDALEQISTQTSEAASTIAKAGSVQVALVEAAGASAEQTINNLVEDAQESANSAKESKEAAAVSAMEAEISNQSAQDYSDLAKQWAVKMDGVVNNEDYSSKYYAQQARETYLATTEVIPDITAAQDAALASIASAGSDQINAVNEAGAAQITLIKQEGTEQIILVQNAGSTAVSNVQSQEETSIANVVAEGEQQIANATAQAEAAAASAEEAKGYAEAAQNAQTAAETARDKALSAQSMAETAQANAEAAQAAAEEARDAAEDWRDDAAKQAEQAGSYAQAAAQSAAEAADSQVQANWEETDAESKAYILNKPDMDLYALKQDLTTIFRYCGTVETLEALPDDAGVGDTYNVEQDGEYSGTNYTWNGESWDKLGGMLDLTPYLLRTDAAETYLGITANAVSASKLQTARTISISSDAEGSASFDGSTDVNIVLTVNNAAQATKLTNERTLSISGDGTGEAVFNGTADADIELTLADTGVSAGSYGLSADASPASGDSISVPCINVDSKGRITSASTYTVVFPSDISGNAESATKLASARIIALAGDASGSGTFDGTADLSIETTLADSGVTADSYGPTDNASLSFSGTFAVPQITVDAKGRATSVVSRTMTLPDMPTTITGNAGSATKLETARTIRTNLASTEVAAFDGTENITPGVTGILPITNGGTGNTVGLAVSAHKLETARTISADNSYVRGSFVFDGSEDVSWELELTDSGVAVGSYGLEEDASPSAGESFDVPHIKVDRKGRVTSAYTYKVTLPTEISGNAGTATKLANARTISLTGAVTGSGTFDGSANLSLTTTFAVTDFGMVGDS